MKMTVEPTDQMFTLKLGEETIVRAWKGTDDSGKEIIALVAGVRQEVGGSPSQLVPIPEPHDTRSPAFRSIAGEMWQLFGRLSDDEALMLLGMVRARTAFQDPAMSERACDRCGKPYRGPSVYCSLDCAVADA
jgi:hypothetical protein